MRILVISAAILLPLPGFAASFDCSRASSLAEMTICNDSELSALDEELAKIYAKAKEAAKDKETFRQQSKAAWLWREKNCRDKESLLKWFSQRKATLTKIADTAAQERCKAFGSVEITGFVTAETLTLEPDQRSSTVYVLNTKDPICVRIEPLDIGEPRNEMTNQFQLVISDKNIAARIKEHVFSKVSVKGELSTNNVTQYYTVPNAIVVRELNEP